MTIQWWAITVSARFGLQALIYCSPLRQRPSELSRLWLTRKEVSPTTRRLFYLQDQRADELLQTGILLLEAGLFPGVPRRQYSHEPTPAPATGYMRGRGIFMLKPEHLLCDFPRRPPLLVCQRLMHLHSPPIAPNNQRLFRRPCIQQQSSAKISFTKPCMGSTVCPLSVRSRWFLGRFWTLVICRRASV
jgi:hypothetical protein